jgi:hypothetical protein
MESRLTNRFQIVLLLTAVAVGLAACDVGPVEPVGRREIRLVGGGSGPGVTNSLVGTWQRTLVFFDEFGFLHSSETTWTFENGGNAERIVVATNETLGAADTLVSSARWRAQGTTLIIDFTAPSPGSITLEFRVQGTTLFLAGQEYQRAN